MASVRTILSILAVACVVCMRANADTFAEQPQANITVVADDQFVINCRTTDPPVPYAHWYKNGQLLARTRFIWASDLPGNFSIVLRNANFSDSGAYHCQNGVNFQNSTIGDVAVLIPPTNVTFQLNNGSASLMFEEAKSHTIFCFIAGATPPATATLTIKNTTIDGYCGPRADGDEREDVCRFAFTPKIDDDGATATCEVEHAALALKARTLTVATTLKVKPVPLPEVLAVAADEPSDDTSGLLIALIVIGAVVLVGLLSGIVVYGVYRWRSNGIKIEHTTHNESRSAVGSEAAINAR